MKQSLVARRVGRVEPLYASVARSRAKSKSGELRALKMPDLDVTELLVSHNNRRDINVLLDALVW